eukprot:Plantae.Rhodophyta-Purpureofilum_apyrenoidigerum.ctg1521.p1 GENE.Plantae.Rhodophyta-Purpureofilum_apyrenoidigerum.ctg1521~~Plantae.Rhodophyta-Purpureofilum_apyrenoidigerum.ctg1521.p1  ORF type:complete len:262 (+),score=45.83 Plantae.Rhodophyta-Purpureofilum_apyrenoidigerum.ctg1521:100-885(+)
MVTNGVCGRLKAVNDGNVAGFLAVWGPVRRARRTQQRRGGACACGRKVNAAVAQGSIPSIYMVIGGPGCGKGTQCERLARDFGMEQVVMGSLLRSEAKKRSELGRQIESIISAGNIVPGDVAMQLLQIELVRLSGKGVSQVLLDGFPRNLQQMKEFEGSIGSYEFALFLDCDAETLQSRLIKRSASSGRADDDENVISVRLKNFEAMTEPLLEHFEAQNRLHRIDAAESIEEVYETARRLFDNALQEKIQQGTAPRGQCST